MKPAKLFLLFLLLLTALRLWACQHFEIQPREAYWYLCGTHPAPAYYDAQGGLPLLVWVSTKCFGVSPLGLRLFMPLFALAASCLVFQLAKRTLRGWTALLPVAALNCLPLFNQNAIQLGWEMPALALGFLSFWGGWVALEKDRSAQGWWFLSGLAAAGAFFMHISMVFVSLSLIATLLAVRKYRFRIFSVGFVFFLTPVLAAIALLILWNRRHEWVWLAMGTFQSATDFSLTSLFTILRAALWELTPLFCVLAGYVFCRLFSHAGSHIRARLLLALCIPPVAVWLYLALLGISHNMLLVIPLILLLIALIQEQKTSQWQGLALKIALLLAALSTAWNLSPVATPWNVIASELQKTKKEIETKGPVFLIAQDADIAAVLSYQLQRNEKSEQNFPPVFVKESQAMESQFSLWPRYEQFVETQKSPDEYFLEMKATNPYIGKSALYVSEEAELPQTIQGAFNTVSLIRSLTFSEKNGVRTIWIYWCADYQTMPL
ncbi:MAG: glycosyltransferase family 39 protein [Chthoniobacterales bacterium]